jgi:DMSO/TMAO reductase YedYZ molybdopterin-dependent catalytic subunit
MNNQPPTPKFNRRRMLQLSGLSTVGLLLNGCQSSEINRLGTQVGGVFEPLNQSVNELMFKKQSPVKEFSKSSIDPLEKLLINSFGETPTIDPTKFQLKIDGDVNRSVTLSLADLQKLPYTSMIIQHICVEGWAAIVHWGGVRISDLVKLVQPKNTARYVYFYSADGYYNSWDLASAMHPQTLLAYNRNDEPIAIDNGAPLRLASPIKLGYKQSKWVTRVSFLSELPKKKGYWEDEGYEWFAGL